MTGLLPGSILAPANELAPFETSVRVLASTSGPCWVIPMDFESRDRKYSRGPVLVERDQLEQWLRAGTLRVSEFKSPAIWQASDEELNNRYGALDGNQCSMVLRRDVAWEAIQPIVERYQDDMVGVLTSRSYARWIADAARHGPHTKAYLLDAFHSYLAADTNQVLLGNTHRCGSPGTQKKQLTKLGRKNAIDSAANRQSTGYRLSEDDKIKLQAGYQCFVTDGRSVHSAWLETSAAFYAEHVEIADGKEKPILKPADERPTERQFEYWGLRADPSRSATRKMLGENEYRLNHRGLPGSATSDVLLVGQRAWTDSSSGDVELTSLASRLITVGSVTYTTVYEARSEIIPGWYIGFEAPSARTQLLALALCALPKADWCDRFGVHGVTERQIPRIRIDQTTADNGEARNGETIRVVLKGWDGWVEFVRAGDGSAKGPVEGEHHIRHREIDHMLPGTTHPPRSESRERTPAILNYREYVVHHIHRIIYHNAIQPAPHLVTTEMRPELSPATATRMDVFHWLVRHGYVNGQPPDPDLIRAHMLPSFPATITYRGVYLHRPDRKGKKEYVNACRFVGAYLTESGLLEAARRNGEIPAEISMDPNDLSVAWFRTPDLGLKRLENVHEDKLLVQRVTLHEALLLQDYDREEWLRHATTRDQNEFDFLNGRDTRSAASLEQYNTEVENCTRPPSPVTEDTASARKAETRLLEELNLTDPIGKRDSTQRATPTSERGATQTADTTNPASDVSNPSRAAVADDVLEAINAFAAKGDKSCRQPKPN